MPNIVRLSLAESAESPLMLNTTFEFPPKLGNVNVLPFTLGERVPLSPQPLFDDEYPPPRAAHPVAPEVGSGSGVCVAGTSVGTNVGSGPGEGVSVPVGPSTTVGAGVGKSVSEGIT